MTLSQVIEHSPAQLKLMTSAASRKKAADALLDLRVTYAACAGAMCEKGDRVLEKTRVLLTHQATNVQ